MVGGGGGGVAVDFVLIPPINPLASCNTNVNGSVESKQSLQAPQTPPTPPPFFLPWVMLGLLSSLIFFFTAIGTSFL